jgi:hypothetical protein
MRAFRIDDDNNVTVYPSKDAAPSGAVFTSAKDRAEITSGWPAGRLAEIWNGFAGTPGFADLRPVKKFETRAIALQRIWQGIQRLTCDDAPKPKSAAKPAAYPGGKKGGVPNFNAQNVAYVERANSAQEKAAPATTTDAKGARPGSKTAAILELIGRKGGATMTELMEATGWRRAMVQSYLSWTIRKRLGRNVERIEGADGAPARYAIAQ